ncbi:MAG: RidA family protein [Rhizomicrobium sp.]|jgi:2-iminobutanoate/2-iminopropanoate deaminase
MSPSARCKTAVRICAVALVLVGTSGGAMAQNQAIGFKAGMNYSDGRIVGQTLYVAGQAGAEGPDAQSKDITAQTTAALAAIQRIVTSAGYQMSDVVSVTVYMTDLRKFPQMNAVYKKFLPDPKPARATVQVAGLVGGPKVEISAIAVKH